MVSSDDLPTAPPEHPPLAHPTDPRGLAQPPSPPTLRPIARPRRHRRRRPSRASGATAGLPPLPVGPAQLTEPRRAPTTLLAALAGVAVVALVAVVVFGFGLGPASRHTTASAPPGTQPPVLDVPALQRGVAPSVVGSGRRRIGRIRRGR